MLKLEVRKSKVVLQISVILFEVIWFLKSFHSLIEILHLVKCDAQKVKANWAFSLSCIQLLNWDSLKMLPVFFIDVLETFLLKFLFQKIEIVFSILKTYFVLEDVLRLFLVRRWCALLWFDSNGADLRSWEFIFNELLLVFRLLKWWSIRGMLFVLRGWNLQFFS